MAVLPRSPVTLDEAAAEMGLSHEVARRIARGYTMKGHEPAPDPVSYEIARGTVGRQYEDWSATMDRVEVWADGRLIYAREHSTGMHRRA